MIIVLDAGPLSVLTNPTRQAESIACGAWLRGCVRAGYRIAVPEIIDYEVRRELLREGRILSLDRLDRFNYAVDFLSIDRPTMLRAAQLWADARNRGRPTADPAALDADVILAAQAQLLSEELSVPVVMATTNARHLTQFVDARGWREITA